MPTVEEQLQGIIAGDRNAICVDPDCEACPACQEALCTVCMGDECTPPCEACSDTGWWSKQAHNLLMLLGKESRMGLDPGKYVQTSERPNGAPPVNTYSPSDHVDVSVSKAPDAPACSFCGKSRAEVAILVAPERSVKLANLGPAAICNECISLCVGLMSTALHEKAGSKDELKG